MREHLYVLKRERFSQHLELEMTWDCLINVQVYPIRERSVPAHA